MLILATCYNSIQNCFKIDLILTIFLIFQENQTNCISRPGEKFSLTISFFFIKIVPRYQEITVPGDIRT